MHIILVNRLGLRLSRKSVVRLNDCLDMILVVHWDVKQQRKINKIDIMTLKSNVGYVQQVTYVIVTSKG